MGTPNTVTKQYVADNRIFADICNYYVYGGKQVIQPEQLYPLDSSEDALLDKADASPYTLEKHRDILKYAAVTANPDTAYLIIGIENQTNTHYAMPVRNMLYDAMQYAGQVQKQAKKLKEEHTALTGDELISGFRQSDSLIPVVTIVLYFGTDSWNGPKSLHDMMQEADPALLQYVADYKLQLIAPYDLSENDLNKFHSSLKQVLTFIKHAKNKEKMLELLRDDAYTAVENAAVRVINACTNAGLHLSDDYEEEIDMCQAIEELKEEARVEGRTEERQAMAKELLRDNIYPIEKISYLTKLDISELEALKQTV